MCIHLNLMIFTKIIRGFISAGHFRTLLAKQNELKLLVELGEYKPGLNAENDKAVELTLPMRHFLCQSPAESVAADETGRLLEQLTQ
ncbi:hypothetical protein [Morganella morganii]|uniref:hypothetical protein n=1 Tax=Morganella morganii TaxID=582 RepID=UPI002023A4FB|nr:hypothetical protein [Morganella morganii]